MKMKNRVGLGTFPLANVFSRITSKQAENIVRLFLNKGGYYIDTAPLYGFGEVEKLLGKVLKGYSNFLKQAGFKIVYQKEVLTKDTDSLSNRVIYTIATKTA